MFHSLDGRHVLVRAPASIANIGPGFDILAMAIKGLYDEVLVSIKSGSGIITVTSQGFNVPSGKDNVAYAVANEFISRYNIKDVDTYIEVRKGIPTSCGLGSSGATSAAVAYALSKVFSLNLRDDELLDLASVGEFHVSGSKHYDNVAASLYGGLTIVEPTTRNVFKYVPTTPINIAVIIPSVVELQGIKKTKYSRSLLPQQIGLDTHVRQTSAIALLIYALFTNNVELLGKAVSVDYIAEPHRSKIIPYYSELKDLALQGGALGFNISGAGPAVFTIHRNMDDAKRAASRLAKFLELKGVKAYAYTTTVSSSGAELLARELNRAENLDTLFQ
ncbi:MAG: homoserine kinase [Desulfurococcaceae archaeon]